MKYLPPKLKKHHKLRIKIALISLAIFILVLGLLIFTPQAIKLTEGSLVTSFNHPWEKPQYLITEAAGAEKKTPPKIVDSGITPPQFFSGAVLAEDFDSGQVLFQKNIHDRLSPASTTKIMTALVAVDQFQPGDELVVPAAAMVGGSSMGLSVGEKLSFRSLLYGMLLNSGNDAAYTIALNSPGGFEGFIKKMNEKAVELGLQDTHFENPAGFDGATHYSSAYDLSQIAKQAVLHPQLSRVVSTKETDIISLDKLHDHPLHNLNKLLLEDGVIGIKTGTTELAGENFVGLVDRNGHKVITVVLKSKDRFGESKKLMDWVYQNFTWQ